MKYRVMIVDDNISNLIMAQKTLEEEYEVLPVSSGLSALECLEEMPDLPDLVVLDIDMPNVNGFQVISEMKNNRKLRSIPAIFLTAQDDATTELESYNLGGIDYIHKPYTASLLKKRVNIQIQMIEQKKKLEDINNFLKEIIQGQLEKDKMMQFSIVDMGLELIKRRSSVLYHHSQRVGIGMDVFAASVLKSKEYDLDIEKVRLLCVASRLHDIGRMALPDSYLEPGERKSLVGYEAETDNCHTVAGADALFKLMPTEEMTNHFTQYIYHMSRSHHECYDGSGYPDGLSGVEIPLEARMLAVVNTYDNLRFTKEYGKNCSHQEALVKIQTMKHQMLDPMLVHLFLEAEKEIERTFL